jgi:hypothetical protein
MLSNRRGFIVGLVSVIAIASFVGSLSPSATAAVPASAIYNAVADFSIAHNPDGTWSYRSDGSLLGYVNKDCDALGMACNWNGKPVCNSAIVGASKAGGPISFLTIRSPADHLVIDPESVASVSVRWTAPTSGAFEIQGDFLGIDTSERSHPVAILDNAKQNIYSNTVSSYGQRVAFDLTRKLAQGETIDFVVSTGSACSYLSTGLKVTVKAAPLLSARTWRVVETVNANNIWDGTWTLDDSHASITATWINRQSGAHVATSSSMSVQVSGSQITIQRPGTGTYSGTISADGTSAEGSMSWCSCTWYATVFE